MRALPRKLLRDLWRLRSQVLTTALVVSGGVAGFIGSFSAHLSLVEIRDGYYDVARFAHVFASARRVPLYIEGELRQIAGVTAVETTVAGNVLVSLPGIPESMTGQVIALPRRGEPQMNRVQILSGRWVAEKDAKGALVSEAFANARHLKPGSTVQLLINGRQESFVVRGVATSPEFVFAAAPGGFGDDSRFGVFWVSRERLEGAYDMRGAFNNAALRLAHGVEARPAIEAIDRLLEPYGGAGAYAREDQLSHRTLTQEINEQRIYAIVFPAVFFAVAVFLLHVLLSRHIATERTQIASLKALGYGNVAIGSHYLQLVMVIVLVGVLIGLGAGVWFGRWMTSLYTGFFHFPTASYELHPALPLSAAAITAGAAVAATARAIRSVVRLPPAEAMRPPAPAAFHRTLLDRLGLGRLYSSEVRMVVRELERRPLRAIVTTLGIASATGILIGGTWWGDALDHLIHVEYSLHERADVVIALNEPAGPSAVQEIARLPGVLEAEGSRSIAADLINGQYRVRAGIVGLDPGDTLRKVLSEQLAPLSLLPGHILLTSMAAKSLHVADGDEIQVDPREGSEPARLFRVNVAAGDFTGRVGYMNREQASRLAGRENTYTVLRVRVDPAQLARFHQELRKLPRVAAVGDKGAMLEQFRANTARNLLVFTGILSVFATFIAVGVVYNSARINLAEHAWELATLRVLGFTRGEVSRILLGQLGVQVLVAIPVGCLFGFLLAELIVFLIQAEDLRIPLVIGPATYAYAALVMLAAGVASAMVVRRRIDQLDLVGVLKTRE